MQRVELTLVNIDVPEADAPTWPPATAPSSAAAAPSAKSVQQQQQQQQQQQKPTTHIRHGDQVRPGVIQHVLADDDTVNVLATVRNRGLVVLHPSAAFERAISRATAEAAAAEGADGKDAALLRGVYEIVRDTVRKRVLREDASADLIFNPNLQGRLYSLAPSAAPPADAPWRHLHLRVTMRGKDSDVVDNCFNVYLVLATDGCGGGPLGGGLGVVADSALAEHLARAARPARGSARSSTGLDRGGHLKIAPRRSAPTAQLTEAEAAAQKESARQLCEYIAEAERNLAFPALPHAALVITGPNTVVRGPYGYKYGLTSDDGARRELFAQRTGIDLADDDDYAPSQPFLGSSPTPTAGVTVLEMGLVVRTPETARAAADAATALRKAKGGDENVDEFVRGLLVARQPAAKKVGAKKRTGKKAATAAAPTKAKDDEDEEDEEGDEDEEESANALARQWTASSSSNWHVTSM